LVCGRESTINPFILGSDEYRRDAGISPIPVRAAATSHQRVEDEDDDEYEDDSRWALMSSSAFLMR